MVIIAILLAAARTARGSREFGVLGLGIRVQGLGIRVQGLGFWVQGLGIMV